MEGRNDDTLIECIPDSEMVHRHINIDSRDRTSTSDSTNDYSVTMSTELHGVRRVELLSAEIPKSEYFLDETNNVLNMSVDLALDNGHGQAPTDLPLHGHIFAVSSGRHATIYAVPMIHTFDHGRVFLHLYSVSHDDRRITFMRKAGVSTSDAPHLVNGSQSSHLTAAMLDDVPGSGVRLLVTCYTEDEAGDVASIRVVTIMPDVDSASQVMQIRNGREQPGQGLAHRTSAGLLMRIGVLHKSLVAIDTSRFGIAYYQERSTVRFRLCAVGSGADEDAQFTNAQPFSDSAHAVIAWEACGIAVENTNDLGSALVVYSTGGELRAVCITTNRISYVLRVSDASSDSALVGSSQSPFRKHSFAVSSFGRHFAVSYVTDASALFIKFGYVTGAAITFTRSMNTSAVAFPLVALAWLYPGEAHFDVRSGHEGMLFVDGDEQGNMQIDVRSGATYTFRCDVPLYLSTNGTVETALASTLIDPPQSTRRVLHVENNGSTFVTLHVPASATQSIFYHGRHDDTHFLGGIITPDNYGGNVHNTLVLAYSGAHSVGLMPYKWGSAALNANVEPATATYRMPPSMVRFEYSSYQNAHRSEHTPAVSSLHNVPSGPSPGAVASGALAVKPQDERTRHLPAVLLTNTDTWLYHENCDRWQFCGTAPPTREGGLLFFTDTHSSGLCMLFGGHGAARSIDSRSLQDSNNARFFRNSRGEITVSRVRCEKDFHTYDVSVDGNSLGINFSTHSGGWTADTDTALAHRASPPASLRLKAASACTQSVVLAGGHMHEWSVVAKSYDNLGDPANTIRLTTSFDGTQSSVIYDMKAGEWVLLRKQIDLTSSATTAVTFTIENMSVTYDVAFTGSHVVRDFVDIASTSGTCDLTFRSIDGSVLEMQSINLVSAAEEGPEGFLDDFYWLTYDASISNTLFMLQVDGGNYFNVTKPFSDKAIASVTGVRVVQSSATDEGTSHQKTIRTHSNVTTATGCARIYDIGSGYVADALEFDGRAALAVSQMSTGALSTSSLCFFSMSCWFKCTALEAALAVDFAGDAVNAVDAKMPTVSNAYGDSALETPSIPVPNVPDASVVRLRPNFRLQYDVIFFEDDFAIAFYVRRPSSADAAQTGDFALIDCGGVTVCCTETGAIRVKDASGAHLATSTKTLHDDDWHHVYVSVQRYVLRLHVDEDSTSASVALQQNAAGAEIVATVGATATSVVGGEYHMAWLYLYDGPEQRERDARLAHASGELYSPVLSLMSARQNDATKLYIELSYELRAIDAATQQTVRHRLSATFMNTSVSTAHGVAPDGWTHVSMLREPMAENAALTLYVNGALAAAPLAVDATAVHFENDLIIGARRTSAASDITNAFVGLMDEPAFAAGNVLRSCYSYVGPKRVDSAVRTWAWMRVPIRYADPSNSPTLSARAFGGRGLTDANGRPLLFGGQTETGFENDVWMFFPAQTTHDASGDVYYGAPPGRWSVLSPSTSTPGHPTGRRGFACTITEATNDLIIFGGERNGVPQADLWAYGIDTGNWSVDGTSNFFTVRDAPLVSAVCSWGVGDTLYFFAGVQFTAVVSSIVTFARSVAASTLYSYRYDPTMPTVSFAAVDGANVPQAPSSNPPVLAKLPPANTPSRVHRFRFTDTSSPGRMHTTEGAPLSSPAPCWSSGPLVYVLGSSTSDAGHMSALWVNQTSGYSAEANLGYGIVMPIDYEFATFPGGASAPVERERITFEEQPIGKAVDNSATVLQVESIFRHGDGIVGMLYGSSGTTFRLLDVGSHDAVSAPIVLTSARNASFTVESDRAGLHNDGTSIRLAYQDVMRNRFGVLQLLHMASGAGLTLDVLDDGTTAEHAIVFSETNPTLNICTMATGGSRTVVAYNASEGATAGTYVRAIRTSSASASIAINTIHAADGTHATTALVRDDERLASVLSAPTLSSSARVKAGSLDLIPLATREADASGTAIAAWLMGFVHVKLPGVSETGRLVLQRIVEGNVVQDVVGDMVHISDDFEVASIANDAALTTVGTPRVVDVRCTWHGEVAVVLWVTATTGVDGVQRSRLRYQDVGTAFEDGRAKSPAHAGAMALQLSAATVDFAQLSHQEVTLFAIAEDASPYASAVVVIGVTGIAPGDVISHSHSMAIPALTTVTHVHTNLAEGHMILTLSDRVVGHIFAGQSVQIREAYSATLIGNAFSPELFSLANNYTADSNVLSIAVIDGSMEAFASESRRCCLAASARAPVIATTPDDECTVIAYVERGDASERLLMRVLVRQHGVQEVSTPMLLLSAARLDLVQLAVQGTGTVSACAVVIVNAVEATARNTTRILNVDLRATRGALHASAGHTPEYKFDPANLLTAPIAPVDMSNERTFIVDGVYPAALPSSNGTVVFTDALGNRSEAFAAGVLTPPLNFRGTVTTGQRTYHVTSAIATYSMDTRQPLTATENFRHMLFRSMSAYVHDDYVMMMPTFSNSNECECTYLVQRSMRESSLVRYPLTVRLEPGDYASLHLLATALHDVLRAVDHHFDVSPNEAISKLTIANQFSAFELIFSNASFSTYEFNDDDKDAATGLGYILGFRNFRDVASRVVADGAGTDVHSISSTNRVDLAGRSYLYLHLTCNPERGANGQSISAEHSTHSASFCRIPLAVAKGETMFFMSNAHYKVFADVQVDHLRSMRVRLTRYHIIETLQDRRQEFLYQPQGVEHSFSLVVHCKRDVHGSAPALPPITRVAKFEHYVPPPANYDSEAYSSDYSE